MAGALGLGFGFSFSQNRGLGALALASMHRCLAFVKDTPQKLGELGKAFWVIRFQTANLAVTLRSPSIGRTCNSREVPIRTAINRNPNWTILLFLPSTLFPR
jgi:hypothetical protein